MGEVLVTGGAGYIGSHIVRRLVETGRKVVVIDDLSEGSEKALPSGVDLVRADFADRARLDELFGKREIRHVIHMAALALVGDSVSDPATYYRQNVVGSLSLLEAAREHKVEGIVFSSTAATYGNPVSLPIDEEHPTRPTNPYGETKLAFERALSWYRNAYGLRYVALRYFNAAGAHPDGDIGEFRKRETHLIPRLLRGILAGEETVVPIFGTDYPTTDGTCVRDYVHVVDLAEAHVHALRALEQGGIEGESFNLGNGEGFSVREVVDMVGKVTGRRPRTEDAPRRAGDPPILVASATRARERLGWQPRLPTLGEIVQTAWNWHESHPRGYES